jgi:hypothetical protein
MNKDQIALVGAEQGGTAGVLPTAAINPHRSLKAVCVDKIDLGTVQTGWGSKHQVKLVFETEETKPNGYRRCASRTYNISYYEKARLRQDLDSWRGRPVSPSEMINGVDFTKLVGKAAELDVRDATTNEGRSYLQIVAIRKAGKVLLAPSGGYRRWQDPSLPAQPATVDSTPSQGVGDLNGAAAALPDDDDCQDEMERQAEELLTRQDSL